MTKMIFVNLPVTDVARATAFYQALGFEQNAQFSNEQASSMMWSDAIVAMLLSREFFGTFSEKRTIDPRSETGALHTLSFDSRAAVDAISEAALAAGGSELHAAEDHGFMYSRAIEDPDGNGWGVMWMDPAAVAGEIDVQHQPAAN